jgi:hypothetical protein
LVHNSPADMPGRHSLAQSGTKKRLTPTVRVRAREPLHGRALNPSPKRITEEQLLRGYGLDPVDLEAEFLDRGPR